MTKKKIATLIGGVVLLGLGAAVTAQTAAPGTPIGAWARFRRQTTLTTPPAGFMNIQVRDSDGAVLATNSSGVSVGLGGGGGTGTVTSVACGTGMSCSPSPITTSGTVAIANTAVTPGSYTSTNLTVDQQGRITAAANGTSGGVTSVATDATLTASTEPIVATGTLSINLGNANAWTAAQGVTSVALSDGATISTNASLSNTFTVTLGGTGRTLANPSNLGSSKDGFTFQWIITQDSGGSKTITTYGTKFAWPNASAPTLQTAANAVDVISCIYLSSPDKLYCFYGGSSGGTTYSAGTGLSLASTTFSIDTSVTVDKTTAQTLTTKTLTAPIINGLTSASGNEDFSGSSGTFKTSTGVNTFGGTMNPASGVDLVALGGASDIDYSASSGVFKTPTGAVTFGGSSYSQNAAYTSAHVGWSLVTLCGAGTPSSCTGTGTNTSAGIKMYFLQATTVTGVRFWWDGSASLTMTAKMWSGGSSLKSCTVAVTTAGVYSCNFASSQAATAGTIYYFTSFSGAGTHYSYCSDTTYGTPASSTPTTRQMNGPYQMYIDNSVYCAGDCQPNASGGAGNFMPVEPLFTVP